MAVKTVSYVVTTLWQDIQDLIDEVGTDFPNSREKSLVITNLEQAQLWSLKLGEMRVAH